MTSYMTMQRRKMLKTFGTKLTEIMFNALSIPCNTSSAWSTFSFYHLQSNSSIQFTNQIYVSLSLYQCELTRVSCMQPYSTQFCIRFCNSLVDRVFVILHAIWMSDYSNDKYSNNNINLNFEIVSPQGGKKNKHFQLLKMHFEKDLLNNYP
jgi:hypothetical protein